ncbi:MAG: transpeptidase family protein [Deltaproteobacteria bacterium]|jgi:cell division protein FtsI (penicillin-binding protein 3)|nr:transpeptidase family protein [Deltaproteobacteria bacterium]
MLELSKTQRARTWWVIGFLGVLFVLIVVRAVELQVVKRDRLRAMQREKTDTVLTINSMRGDIYDRNLEKLATSVVADRLAIHAPTAKNQGEVFYELSRILDISYEELARLMETKANYTVLKRNLTQDETRSIRELKLPGIVMEEAYLRVYPNGPLAGHLLGFVGVDGQGLEGLELALDQSLNVPPKKIKVKRDKRGRVIMGEAPQEIRGFKGASVILTLDKRIQFIAEKALAKAVTDTNAKSGMVIAVRPATGEIIASAVYPNFDPNQYGLVDTATRRNMILTDPFEPGSTFKVFTVAAALEEKIITPESTFYCEQGFYRINGDTVIRDTSPYGDLNTSQIVQKSSNICASKIGERLGSRKFYNYLTRFAFGEKSGLAYPSGESAGLLRPVKDWHVVDAANHAFGQGLSVTALQLVMGVAALGNDGALMRPMLVSRVIDAQGNIIEQREPDLVRQVVSPLTARQVLAMMRLAVMKGGTGTRADIPEYPIAGKTGTSQKYNHETKSYSHDKFVASFVGLAPYQNPELCLLVVLDEPVPYYGGISAAPVFREIMSQALPLLDVPPTDKEILPIWPSLDKPSPGAPGVLSDYSSSNFVRVRIPKGDKGAKGPIQSMDPYPTSTRTIADYEYPFRETRPISPQAKGIEVVNPFVMPELKGLTTREVMRTLSQHRLSVEYFGTGVAFNQEPKAGSTVAPGDIARVSFQSRNQGR